MFGFAVQMIIGGKKIIQKTIKVKSYGKELILDIHNCNPKVFQRDSVEYFLKYLCDEIDMERCDLHFWDYQDEPEEYKNAPDHLKGISCIQFITTSNITIHTLDVLKKVFLNVFSCKDFDSDRVVEISLKFFNGTIKNKTEIIRE